MYGLSALKLFSHPRRPPRPALTTPCPNFFLTEVRKIPDPPLIYCNSKQLFLLLYYFKNGLRHLDILTS